MRLLASLSLGTAALLCPIALCAAEPSIVDDDQLSINFGFDVQTRAETAFAHNSLGQSYDIYRGEVGKSDQVQYSMRRARLLMDGSYGPNWKFFLGFLADNIDRDYYNENNTQTASSSGGGRQVALYKAYMKRIVPLGSGSNNISFQAGMDYPYFNRAIIGDPYWLFAEQRASGNYMGPRGVGGRFMASGHWYDFAIDVMEGLDQDRGSATSTAANGGATPGSAITAPTGNAGQVEGMWYSSRLEVWAFNSEDKKPAYHESYKGKQGHSLLVAIEGALDNRDFQEPGTRMNSQSCAAESLLHWDGLSALVEARFLNVHEDPTAGAAKAGGPWEGKDNANIYIAQAGYAIPVMGITIEPALRYNWVDNNVGDHSTIGAYNGGAINGAMAIPGTIIQNSSGNPDGMNSGRQVDAGVNFYFNRVMGCQLSYSYWKAKTGEANANIIRTQFQCAF